MPNLKKNNKSKKYKMKTICYSVFYFKYQKIDIFLTYII